MATPSPGKRGTAEDSPFGGSGAVVGVEFRGASRRAGWGGEGNLSGTGIGFGRGKSGPEAARLAAVSVARLARVLLELKSRA